MKKLCILVLFILLCSCSNTNVFNGDILSYKNEITWDEWSNKREELFEKSDLYNRSVNRDLSSIIKYRKERINKIDNKLNEKMEEIINVSYDKERKIIATVYNDDFSTRYCKVLKENNIYDIKIINLEIVEKNISSDDADKLSYYARESFYDKYYEVNTLIEINKAIYDSNVKYYFDTNTLTIVFDYNSDLKYKCVIQYVFSKKYICLNYFINSENDKIKENLKFCSYILFEQVEIAPISV